MSIRGLTDRGLSFPQIGNVRKGGKKEKRTDKNGREYEIQGKDLTYFRVEFDEKEPISAALFLDKYGNQPTEINFVFPFNEIDRCWEAWLEAYTAGRMVARSDGEYFTYWLGDKGEVKVLGGVDENGAKVPHIDIVGKDYKNNPVKLRPVGRLRIVIPELQRLAYLVVHTTSKHDIINISEQLEGIRTINGGRLVGIPLVLRRRPRMISTPDPNDAAKRVRREKWLLSIEADPEWVKAKLLEVKRAALPGNGLALLTGEAPPAPVEEWGEDDEEDFDEYPGNALTGEIIETDAGQTLDGNGYDDDFDPSDNDEGGIVETFGMSLEMALTELDSKGIPYGQIDSQVLSNKTIGIDKALKKNGLTHAQREEYERKRDAIKIILAHRNRQLA